MGGQYSELNGSKYSLYSICSKYRAGKYPLPLFLMVVEIWFGY
jgi:hypothetical protein